MPKIEMTPPRVVSMACVGIAVASQAGLLRTDPVAVALLMIMAATWLYIDWLQATLGRHQKALQWFADHVYQREKQQPGGEAPPELADLVKPH